MNVLRLAMDSGVASPASTNTEIMASYRDDRIASYCTAAWATTFIKQSAGDMAGHWGVFRLPAIHPGGLRASNLGGSVLVIPSECDQPKQAIEFAKFALCTVQGQMQQFRQYGLFPSYLPAYRDPYFQQPDPFLVVSV